MYLLERYISEYTHHNILIGIFKDLPTAQRAKSTYIETCEQRDQWAEQAYRTVNLEKDVNIYPISDWLGSPLEAGISRLYVVSCYVEGFGQVIRNTEKIFGNRKEADAFKLLKESIEPEYEPCWYELLELSLNAIYYDHNGA